MKKRAFKLLICICVISCLMVGFCTSFASAVDLGGAGLLGSALSSLGVDLLAGGSATFAALAPWLNSDFSIIGGLTGVADGFIKVKEDSVIIDGVEYQSIFLDPSMATELHIQAFDFITNKAIISNSSGILATGSGYIFGIPVYRQGSSFTTQTLNVSSGGTFVWGDLNCTVDDESSDYYNFKYNGSSVNAGYFTLPSNFRYYRATSGSQFLLQVNGRNTGTDKSYNYISDAFSYSYVSGDIDADPLPSNYGFNALVPVQSISEAGITPGTYIIDGGAGEDTVIQLIHLLDDLYAQESIKNAEFAEESEPVPPVPTTTIADTAYSDLHAEMMDIKNNQAHANSAIDNIDLNIDTIGRTVDHLDETVTDIEGYIQTGASDIVDSVDTVGQSVVDGLSDVEGAIDTYGQSVVTGLGSVETALDTAGQSVVDSVDAQTQALEQSIADVADKVESLDTTVDEVIEKVESHPLDLFGAFLDRLTQIPVIKDLFDGIKQHVGIWHYVVEWLQCIGTFLAFFIGLFSDVAYCMVVPIYACVAGAICLAFYKRFGR